MITSLSFAGVGAGVSATGLVVALTGFVELLGTAVHTVLLVVVLLLAVAVDGVGALAWVG